MTEQTKKITVELLVTDNPFERARKAWSLMGFVNDRTNCIGALAEVFMAYQEFDKGGKSS